MSTLMVGIKGFMPLNIFGLKRVQQTLMSIFKYKGGASSHCPAIFCISGKVKLCTFLAAQP
ncbi:hypothetical protein Hanom_Chr02g00129121 [Helianthus anomalus]